MCTVTWWRDADADSFGVWFNRDERRIRPASELVRVEDSDDGIQFLAPRDPAAGGTWLMANAHGLVVAVLNFYAAGERPDFHPTSSRGMLPRRHTSGRSVDDVEQSMNGLDCGAFAPFVLMAWDLGRTVAWSWDGIVLQTEEAPVAPVTTSSHRSVEVGAWRRARYPQLVGHATADTLTRYHDDVAHADPAFNVQMHRPDARTESMCRVTVTPAEVRFWHRREQAEAVAGLDSHEAVIARS